MPRKTTLPPIALADIRREVVEEEREKARTLMEMREEEEAIRRQEKEGVGPWTEWLKEKHPGVEPPPIELSLGDRMRRLGHSLLEPPQLRGPTAKDVIADIGILANKAMLVFDPPAQVGAALVEWGAQMWAPGGMPADPAHPVAPQLSPQTQETFAIVRGALSKDIGPAEALGLLRRGFGNRSLFEQVAYGAVFDVGWLIPVGKVKAVVKGAGAGVKGAVRIGDTLYKASAKAPTWFVELMKDERGFTRLMDDSSALIHNRAAAITPSKVQASLDDTERMLADFAASEDPLRLKDRLHVEIALGTGARVGEIERLSLARMEELVNTGRMEAVAKKGVASQTYRVLDNHRLRIKRAFDDLKTHMGKRFPTDPNKQVLQGDFTGRIKSTYKALYPAIPDEARKYRHLVLKQWRIQGLSDDSIMQAVGHHSKAPLYRAYLEELGVDIGPNYEQMLSTMEDVLPETQDLLRIIAKETRDTGFLKGKRVRLFEEDFAIENVGEGLIRTLERAPDEAEALAALQRMADPDNLLQTQHMDLYERGMELESLKHFLNKLGRLKADLDLNYRTLESVQKKAKAAGDADVVKAALESKPGMEVRRKLVREFANNIGRFLASENSLFERRTNALAAKGIGVGDLDILFTRITGKTPVERELQEAWNWAKNTRNTQATTRRRIRQRGAGSEWHSEIGYVEQPLPSIMTPKVRRWVGDPDILNFLDARLHSKSSPLKIKTTLRQLADTAPEAYGDTFATRTAGEQDKLLDTIAATIWGDPEITRKFVLRSPKQKVAKLPTGGKAPPPVKPFKRPLPDMPPQKPTFGAMTTPQQAVGETYLHLDEVVSQVKTGLWRPLRAAREAIGGAKPTGLRLTVQSMLDHAIGQVHGGLSPALAEYGRIGAAVNQSFYKAESLGEMARATTQGVFARLGVRFTTLKPKALTIGGQTFYEGGAYSRVFSTDDVLVKIPEPTLNKRLRALGYTAAEIEERMRSWHVIVGSIDYADLDTYYVFANPQAKTAILWYHHLIQSVENIMAEATSKVGFDLKGHLKVVLEDGHGLTGDDLADAIGEWDVARETPYSPRSRVSVAGVSVGRIKEALFNDLVKQSHPQFLYARKHKDYGLAIGDGTVYADPLDDLARYVATVHMMVVEYQARVALRQWHVPLGKVSRAEKGMKALMTMVQDLSENKLPSTTVLDIAAKYDRELALSVKQNPAAMRETIAAHQDAIHAEYLRRKTLHSRQLAPGYAKGLAFEDAVFSQLDRMTREGTNVLMTVARGARYFTQNMRFFRTGFDHGSMFIHGLPMLFENPALWAKSFGRQFQMWFSERYWHQFIAVGENASALTEMTHAGGMAMGKGEPTEALEFAPGLLGAVGKGTQKVEALLFRGIEELPLPIPKQLRASIVRGAQPVGLVRRYERAFNIPLAMARIELWKALRVPGMSLDEMTELAAHINKATGVYNFHLAGLTPGMRAVRSGMLFFAPLYRWAAYGLMIDIFRGGMRSELALKRLTSLAAGGLMMGAVAKAMGNEDAFNFRSPRVMSFKIGDGIDAQYIGMGSAFYSLARLGMALKMVVSGALVSEGRAEQKALERFLSISDNQLLTWLRSQASPPLGLLWSFMTNRTYIGDPLADPETLEPDWGKVASLVGEQFAPFYMDIDEGSWEARVGEYFGLRSVAITAYDKATYIRDQFVAESNLPSVVRARTALEKAGRPVNWDTMPSHIQNEMRAQYQGLRDVDAELNAHNLERGDLESVHFATFSTRMAETEEKFRQDQHKWLTQYGDTYYDGETFRKDYDDMRAARAVRIKDIAQDPELQDVIIRLNRERRKRLEKPSGYLLDFAYDVWRNMADARLKDLDGVALAEAYDELWDLFSRMFNDDSAILNSVRDRYLVKLEPEFRAFEEAKDSLRQGYWRIHLNKWGTEGSSPNATKLSIIEQYVDAGQDWGLTEYHNRSPQHEYAKSVVREWEHDRNVWKATHPEDDWVLYLYYDNNPQAQVNIDKANARLRQYGITTKTYERTPYSSLK